MSRSSTDAAKARLLARDAAGGTTLEELPTPFVLDALFGRPGPVEMEVGAGKGRFVAERAGAEPSRNFLAVERARRYAAVMGERLARSHLANARVIVGDAAAFIEEFLPGESLAGVHVYFPDPWPKKRHHKRRLFQAPFVQGIERVLAPGGFLSLASDVKSYVELIVECISQAGQRLGLAHRAVNERPAAFAFPTHFELKYRQAGRSVYYVLWTKR